MPPPNGRRPVIPYIKAWVRPLIDEHRDPRDVGELNYCFTRMMLQGASEAEFRSVIDKFVNRSGPMGYRVINNVLGAATGANLERERRLGADDGSDSLWEAVLGWYDEIAGPYEDRKIEQNGDVY